MSEKQELPIRYLELKDLIAKSPSTSKNQEVYDLKSQYFEEIYENYFWDLPKDEQTLIEIRQVTMDVNFTDDVGYCEPLLEEYLEDIREKEILTENDIRIISLYFDYVFEKGCKREEFDFFVQKLINYIPFAVDIQLIAIGSALSSAVGVEIIQKNYPNLIIYIDGWKKIFAKSFHYPSQPSWTGIEGVYTLFVKQDVKKAKEMYSLAAEQAKYTQNDWFAEMVLKQWEEDLKEYDKKK